MNVSAGLQFSVASGRLEPTAFQELEQLTDRDAFSIVPKKRQEYRRSGNFHC